MLDCVSVPYSNYANLVSSVLDAREVWLVLDMLVQRYDEFGPSDRWFSCLSTQVSFLKQRLAFFRRYGKTPRSSRLPGVSLCLLGNTYFLGYLQYMPGLFFCQVCLVFYSH